MIRAAAVILAAGASTRLGERKQLALLAGERLLERAIRIADEAGCAEIVVVLGFESENIAAQCNLGRASVVVNDLWREGLASSIRAGIAYIANSSDRALLMTCDQPAVTPNHLVQLKTACAEAPIASSYANRQGIPACFPARSFPDLLHLRGDIGARDLLAAAPSIALPGGELDIDTPEALNTARQLYEQI